MSKRKKKGFNSIKKEESKIEQILPDTLEFDDDQTFESIIKNANVDEEQILADIEKIGYESEISEEKPVVLEEVFSEPEVTVEEIDELIKASNNNSVIKPGKFGKVVQPDDEKVDEVELEVEIPEKEIPYDAVEISEEEIPYEEEIPKIEIADNIEFEDEDEKPLTEEDGIDINSYEDISSNSRISKLKINKEKFLSIAKKGIAVVAAVGVITGAAFIFKSCGKKNKSTDVPENPTTSTIETTTVPNTTNDELDVEVEVNTKPVPTEKGEIDSKNVVIDKNGTAWESKEDASNAPKNGNKEVKVESGYLAPDGNVYESKEEYQKLISAKNATKKTEKKLYYATDGTAFESEKDRDAWNKALKEQKSTTKKMYYATDGTAFEKESDRDAWNKKLKEQKSTEKVYYIADDGTYFETEKDMNDWNNYLKSQKADAVQKNAYSSKQEEIYLLKQYKDLIITSSLVYNNQEDEKTFSL